MLAHLKRELGLCVVPICNNLEPIVIDSPSPTRGYLGNTTHPDQIWFDMKKNTTTVFKVSENVDIDIDIVSCNPLIFLWNNLEFYMCGANFYCRSCVLAFLCFHAWMQFCGYISFVMCGSVVIVVLSLTRPWLYLPHIMVQHALVEGPSPASGPSSPSVSIWAKGGQLWGWSQMVLIKAILHANWTLTNEYPPFCNAKKSTSKTLV